MSGITLPHILIDLAIIVIVGVNVAMGIRYGLIRRIFVFAVLFGAIGGASLIAQGAGANFSSSDVAVSSSWTWIGIVVGLVIIAEVITGLYQEHISQLASLAFERMLGGVMGALLGLAQVCVIAYVAISLSQIPSSANLGFPQSIYTPYTQINGSLLGHLIIKVEPSVTSVFTPVLPPNGAYFFAGVNS